MPHALRGVLSVLGRVLLCTIFFMSAVGEQDSRLQRNGEGHGVRRRASTAIPAGRGDRVPDRRQHLGRGGLQGAHRCDVAADLSVLATYFFHDFWTMEGTEQEQQMIQFMKNLSMMGAMLLIIANGTGAWSVDERTAPTPTEPTLH